MAGKSLKGSKSVDNLKDAFAGESQANRRYLLLNLRQQRCYFLCRRQ